ncbi:glycoside hydrolase family protein [Rouxiella sp. S1S-2]|uniref:lysozyme n=1 Tax=Rouxiella sp. S1S-2 TaxID=2653856 RepID=UPI0012650D15|nr:lysozyme [Rouxiella sp. S1S-2]KAB7895997.1 glycoside hydrolase family protein [Rouxiella sp. S1S-2]
MKISSQGIGLIKQFEGLRLSAYRCSAGVLTIGYGHTSNVQSGQVITKAQAELFLTDDLVVVERAVGRLVSVSLTQNQYDAISSFVFNLGCRKFSRSTLLKKLSIADFDGAANQFGRWVRAKGKVSGGLVARRKIEAELFLL